jgi:hypothetical protein
MKTKPAPTFKLGIGRNEEKPGSFTPIQKRLRVA